jgi:hypothetical protein
VAAGTWSPGVDAVVWPRAYEKGAHEKGAHEKVAREEGAPWSMSSPPLARSGIDLGGLGPAAGNM